MTQHPSLVSQVYDPTKHTSSKKRPILKVTLKETSVLMALRVPCKGRCKLDHDASIVFIRNNNYHTVRLASGKLVVHVLRISAINKHGSAFYKFDISIY